MNTERRVLLAAVVNSALLAPAKATVSLFPALATHVWTGLIVICALAALWAVFPAIRHFWALPGDPDFRARHSVLIRVAERLGEHSAYVPLFGFAVWVFIGALWFFLIPPVPEVTL